MQLLEESDNNNEVPFKFTGEAGEYFGIWSVNNIFTWMTLGIYSAWAKVRTLQYFYGNTEFAGSRFNFTGEPLKILRGRVIAVLLFILYFAVENIETRLAAIVFVTLLALYFVFAPVLLVLVMSFKLRYSEWRGISFNFKKNYREAYRVYLIPISIFALFIGSLGLPIYSTEVEEYFGYESPMYQSDISENEDLAYDDYNEDYGEDYEEAFDDDYNDEYEDDFYDDDETDSYMNPYLAIPSLIMGILMFCLIPYFDFINMRFLSRNARLGTAPFTYHATIKDYYSLYGKWLFAALIILGLWAIEWKYDALSDMSITWALLIASVLFIPITRSYFKSARYNLLLNKTLIDNKHQLKAKTNFMTMFWIMMTNSIVNIFTLGLMRPWAQIRTTRYILESSSVEVNGSLDDFIASQEKEVNALAEEVADIFDLELLG